VRCFNLVHHLTAGHIVSLFGRVRESLSPGGTLAVMDAFAEPAGGASAAANFLAMFVYLSSGAHVHTPAELCIWLWKAGFTRPPRRIRIPRTPGQVVSGGSYVIDRRRRNAEARHGPAGTGK
jgi:hypothetical protein